jgi:hypothetical protein
MTAIEAMTGAVADEIFGKGFALSEARRDFCLKVARAALIALRDCGVTEPMRAACLYVAATYSGYGEEDELDVGFRAMLDAAIDEG